MARKIQNKGQVFSKRDIDTMVDRISSLADNSSKIVYVYPYTKSQVINVNTSLNQGYKMASRMHPRPVVKRNRIGHPALRSSRRWAIRVEGHSDPIDKVFTSKEQAIRHARKLVENGHGNMLNITK